MKLDRLQLSRDVFASLSVCVHACVCVCLSLGKTPGWKCVRRKHLYVAVDALSLSLSLSLLYITRLGLEVFIPT